MEKLSARKVSLLGLVLLGASAVTAAVLPAKKNASKDRIANGKLQAISASAGLSVQDTCITAASQQNCNETTSHGTTPPSKSTVSGGTSATDNNAVNTTVADA
jgi:hypothetical protein